LIEEIIDGLQVRRIDRSIRRHAKAWYLGLLLEDREADRAMLVLSALKSFLSRSNQ
jgi:hypothetical protein